VQPAAHAKCDVVCRRRIGDRALQLQRRANGIERIVERRVQAVADHLDDDAAMILDRRARQRIVARQRIGHALRLLFPQPRAAFDIGEEQGDAGRRAGVHDDPDEGRAVTCKYKRIGGSRRSVPRAHPGIL
jgi:hypothetical protein